MNPGRDQATTSCPSDEQLFDLVRGRLTQEDEARLAEHITSCEGCQSRIESVAGTNEFNAINVDLTTPDSEPNVEKLIDKIATRGPRLGEVKLEDLLTPSPNPKYLGMFDDYEVIEIVGHGGMGVVLKARDPSLDRIVAIKTLLPHLALSGRARGRFMREAKNTAAVNHPNIVTIHSVDVRKGIPYLVMEFVQGRSLEEELAKGPITDGELVRISHQIALALTAAHAQGLIHRDIKPANILLENGVPRVKVTDFGLSRAIDDTSITKSGTIAGTPQFMSPEQAEGKTADSKSDLFSLGSVMYTMCTGKPAFQGESSLAVMRNVCDSTPTPIRKLNPTIPVWIARIVEGLIRKNPDRRPSAKDAARMLAGGMTSSGDSKPGWKWAFAIAACVLFGLVGWQISQRSDTGGGVVSGGVVGDVTRRPSKETQAASLEFRIVGQVETFYSLAEAVAAALDGDVIKVSGDGRHKTDEIEIFGKELTIEAVEGSRPTFAATDETSHILRSDSSLILRGLTFVPRVGERRPAVQFRHSVIRSTGDSLVIDRCSIEGEIGVSGIGVNCKRVDIINSYVSCKNSSGLVVKSEKGTLVNLKNCVFECRLGFTVLIEGGTGRPQVDLSNSTFQGGIVCRLAPDQTLTPDEFRSITEDTAFLNVRTKNSLFDVNYVVLNSPPRPVRLRQPAQALGRAVWWEDERSFYRSSAVPAAVQRRRDAVAMFRGESAWSDWTELHSIPNEDCVRGTIRYVDTESVAPMTFALAETDPQMDALVGANVSQVGPR